jgi:hypothetical protein
MLNNSIGWIWYRSYFKFFAFRFILTPIGTIIRDYHFETCPMRYRDIYVFGFRVARIHILP